MRPEESKSTADALVRQPRIADLKDGGPRYPLLYDISSSQAINHLPRTRSCESPAFWQSGSCA